MTDACGHPIGLSAGIRAMCTATLENNPRCGMKFLAPGGRGYYGLGNLRPNGDWPVLFGKCGQLHRSRLELPALCCPRRLSSYLVPIKATDGFLLLHGGLECCIWKGVVELTPPRHY